MKRLIGIMIVAGTVGLAEATFAAPNLVQKATNCSVTAVEYSGFGLYISTLLQDPIDTRVSLSCDSGAVEVWINEQALNRTLGAQVQSSLNGSKKIKEVGFTTNTYTVADCAKDFSYSKDKCVVSQTYWGLAAGSSFEVKTWVAWKL